jgi:hypothetical protein
MPTKVFCDNCDRVIMDTSKPNNGHTTGHISVTVYDRGHRKTAEKMFCGYECVEEWANRNGIE